MYLTVIVSKMSAGIQQMLDRELEGIDAEVIVGRWSQGLKKARGDFVCLLEKDSAIKRGTIRENLKCFTDNPSYRKLAMVSPMVDYDDVDVPLSFSYEGSVVGLDRPSSSSIHAVRVGYVPGAIIRRSSLLKIDPELTAHPLIASTTISLEFWSHGLRVELNPDTVYYSPIKTRASGLKKGVWCLPSETIKVWDRELIR